MRQLRLVGLGEEGRSLIVETPDGTEQFSLPNDVRLRELSQVDLPRIGKIVNEAASPMAPRDIQMRVRAGADPQALADEAGVSLERIMRFAYPVLQERIRVTDEARRGRARRGSEGQLTDFGELVELRLSAHGVEPAAIRWDAFRREDGGWTVTASFVGPDRPIHSQPHGERDDEPADRKPQLLTAKFSFALMSRTVTALEEIAADVLSDRPIKALLPPPPPPVFDGDDEQAPGVRLTAVPDPADVHLPEPNAGTTVRPPSRRQKAHTHPVPLALDDELFDQEALDEPWHEPPLPLDLGLPLDLALPAELGQPADLAHASGEGEQPAADAHEAAVDDAHHKRGRRAGEKPRMPSWDDILLGVRHKSE